MEATQQLGHADALVRGHNITTRLAECVRRDASTARPPVELVRSVRHQIPVGHAERKWL